MKLEDEDDQLIALAAHRYCLGRQSDIVGACLNWLRQTWNQMQPSTQHVMLRDTVEALVDGQAGSPLIGAPGWKSAARWMAERMPPERLATVREALAWKGAAVDDYLPPNLPLDPCPGCMRGGTCSKVDCGRKRSSELMDLYGTP
jgi:hypothetical protein